MSGATPPEPETPAGPPAPPGRRVPRRRLRAPDWGRYATWAVLCWLFTPIAFMALFGFNDISGRQNVAWQGFTLRWYGQVFSYPDLTAALLTTAVVGVLTMLVSGVVGGLLGLALGRYRFRGRGATNLVLFAAVCAPEVVTGAALLSLFLTLNIATGLAAVVLAHVMFTVSYVAITVRVRVMTLDPRLEEAARDLGAGPWTTFRLVTLPALLPAVTAGGLLALALSVDDFVITSFVRGDATTFPLWVWGATRVGIPPQVNVMGTLIFATGVLLAVGNVLLARRRR
ncbi:ABC transporter permease [Marinitenerispora sediminis]|uniref:ABC transporter permease n=1 Tax=Marinitenerispora sediminis TaxID=1931232 RepID=A0A368T1U5_9ACTN|nr:ABC transporter permease [Marinitenerispora sediminis]RCV50936.1 ABC transporter permease [Marinitenerispora sediminis]RCV51614.1 ABC transporter permease [Marinitenerispora sediminis]RCV54269.1 ABC transporter permease [Marinitenerispora sediminis]